MSAYLSENVRSTSQVAVLSLYNTAIPCAALACQTPCPSKVVPPLLLELLGSSKQEEPGVGIPLQELEHMRGGIPSLSTGYTLRS